MHKYRLQYKYLTVWLVVLLILLIKSQLLLVSLYGATWSVFLIGSIAVVPIMFFMSFAFIFPPKGAMVYLLCLDVFISLLFITDMIYARAYGHLISIYMMFSGGTMTGLDSSIISLARWSDVLMLIDLPWFIYLVYKSKKRPRVPRSILLFVFVFFLGSGTTLYGFHSLESNDLLGDTNRSALIMSPLGNHVYDVYRFIYEKNDALDKSEEKSIDQWISENQKYLAPDDTYSSLRGIIQGKNIITIQWESLEKFVVNETYDGQEITPIINGLLKHSIYFSNIVEQVVDGNSSDAELMFNTSVYPIKSGSAFLRFSQNKYCTLPNLLHEYGYVSKAIHGDNKEFWNRDQVYPALGFDDYIDETQFEDQRGEGMGLLDESLFEQSLIEIGKMKEPFNLFAITLTSHMPFALSEDLATLDLTQDDISAQYLQSIHYTDNALGAFIDKLESSGILKNSVLIIYGDHQGIHKYYDTTLPENNNRIPFIIYIPGLDGFEVNKVGGQIDMLPTLAYLLGIDQDKYEDAFMGRNLFGKYSGSGILATGKVLYGTDGVNHLKKAYNIADLYVRGNYYKTVLEQLKKNSDIM